MAYCTNCGKYVEDGLKFCGHCGTKLEVNDSSSQSKPSEQTAINQSSQRKTVYDGEIHKCPHCGAPLASFVKNCPECGNEIRSSSDSSSVHSFGVSYANAINNSQKIDLIRTFVIPNTKEDIIEFVFLAHSNIDTNSYLSDDTATDVVSQQDITEAWMAKLEQAYQKANFLLPDDPYLEKINNLYLDKKKALIYASKKIRRKRRARKFFGKKGNIILLAILVPTIIYISSVLIFNIACDQGNDVKSSRKMTTSDYYGTWKVTGVTSNGKYYSIEELEKQDIYNFSDCYIILRAGSADLHHGINNYNNVSWKVTEKGIAIENEEMLFEDGKLSLTFNEKNATVFFERELS